MAIRIRLINGEVVALCAAESEAEPGDIYLDDNVHHALTGKFYNDFDSEGIIKRREVKILDPETKQDKAKRELFELISQQPQEFLHGIAEYIRDVVESEIIMLMNGKDTVRNLVFHKHDNNGDIVVPLCVPGITTRGVSASYSESLRKIKHLIHQVENCEMESTAIDCPPERE